MRSRGAALRGPGTALLLLVLLLAASLELSSTAPARKGHAAKRVMPRKGTAVAGAKAKRVPSAATGAGAGAKGGSMGLAGRLPAAAQTAASLEVVQRLCACSPLGGKLRARFQDVVLVVNTNYEFAVWATTPFWRRTFGRFFLDVVIFSPRGIRELNVKARASGKKWDYAYFDLLTVFKKYKKASGFLWTNDDVAINYWNLMKGDKTNLWWPINPTCSKGAYYPFNATEPAQWHDWAGNGINRRRTKGAYSKLPTKYRAQFDISMGRKGYYPRGIADLFYIPRRYVRDLEVLIPLVGIKARVPSEIALPMMFYCLEPPTRFDPVLHDMVYLWSRGRSDISAKWSPHVSALHPWKISNPVTRLKWAYTAGFYDPCLLHDALTGQI